MKDPPLTVTSERRLGRFVGDHRLLQTVDLRVLRRMMRNFVVLYAVPIKDEPQRVVYTAYSHLFDRVAVGQDPPQYTIEVSNDGETVTCKRIALEPSALDKMRETLDAREPQGVV